MNERNESRNKNILIGALLAVVLIMGVGYAAFAQQLTITGNANITSTWDVHIQSIEKTGSTGTGNSTSATVGEDGLSASFTADLQSPTDSVTYTVTVVNAGTLDAKVAAGGITTQETNPAAPITYSYSGISAGDVINANNQTKTFTVTVTYDDVTEQPDQLTNTYTLKLNFEQSK